MGGLLLAFVLLLTGRPDADAQSISVPLGTAAPFGLLSGGTLTADTASAAYVSGRAGAATALTGPVQASGSVERPSPGTPPLVTTALTDLAAARTYCTGLSSTTLTAPLNGQTLTGGAYTLTGNVTFGSGNPLVLQGSDTTVFVINVTGDLTLTSGARVWLDGRIAPKNIYWNVGGNLSSSGYAALPGVVMTGGTVSVSDIWAGTAAMLATGNLTLTQARFTAAEAGTHFFSAESLLPPAECASTPLLPADPCASRAFNGDFETPAPGLANGVPTEVSNVCNRLPNTLNEVAGWGAASQGTPDWFKAGGTPYRVDVPLNALNDGGHPTYSNGILGNQGIAYAGLFACRDHEPGATPFNPNDWIESREYLMQRLPVATGQSSLEAGRDYYVAFYSSLASRSEFTVRQLGLRFFDSDPYLSTTGVLLQGGTTAYTPHISAHDASFPTLNQWTRNAGFYRATGNERFVVVGNFDRSPNAQITAIPGRNQLNTTKDAYYYIDDVQILPFPLPRIECGITTQDPDPNGLPNPAHNPRENLHLFVDCPLPVTSGAIYEWKWTDPCQELRANPAVAVPCNPLPLLHIVRTSDHNLFPPYPYAASYTLTVYVPTPGIANPVFPQDYYTSTPHTIANDATTGMFEFTIDETDLALKNITTSQTWSADKTIRGTITVWPGATLTINNHAVIRFDDTFRQKIVPTGTSAQIFSRNPLETRILVKPGGHLVIQDGAVLTSLIAPDPYPNEPDHGTVPDICHYPFMWDGVTAEGSPTLSQRDANGDPNPAQSWVSMTTEGTIAHARIGLMAGFTSYAFKRILASSSYVGWLITAQSGRGRAVVQADHGRFLECWYGAILRDCRESPPGNPGGALPTLDWFNDCLVQSTQVLAEPEYRTTTNVRYGTQVGINLVGMNEVAFTGNTFDGFAGAPVNLRGVGMQISTSVARIMAAGYNGGVRWDPIRPNVFQDWQVGLSSDGTFLPAILTLRGNRFSNNYFGATFKTLSGADVRFNQFWVGGPGMTTGTSFSQPVGLIFNNAGAVQPEENRFVPHPGCGINTQSIGLRFEDTGAAAALAHNNSFTGINPTTEVIGVAPGNLYLYVGLMTAVATQGNNNDHVTFRCNNFEMPAAAISGSNFPSSDVQIYGGTMAQQGDCPNRDQTPPERTPNNRFTDNSNVTRQHLFLRAGNNAATSTAFKYWYAADARMQPTACSLPFISGTSPLVEPCGNRTNGFGCDPLPIQEDVNGLRAELAQTTAGSLERTLALDRLVRELVTNYTISHGLDSAIALLERENDPGHATYLLQLQSWRTANGGGGSSQRMANPTGPLLTAKAATGFRTEAATATADRTSTSYLLHLRDLLEPLDTDSARTIAVMTNATLRAELVRMAEDSLTDGYLAVRSALNQYGGTHYQLRATDDTGADGTDGLGRTAAPSEPLPTAFLILTPNPSTGQVRVGYGLPEKAARVAVCVYDEWGQPQGTHALTDEALAAGVILHLRPGLYQCVLKADGKVMARQRLLIIR